MYGYNLGLGSGGNRLPRTGLIFYARAPGMVDSIGLSASDYLTIHPSIRSIFFSSPTTKRSDADIVDLALASPLLNKSPMLGDASKIALYVYGTAPEILTKAANKLGVVYTETPLVIGEYDGSIIGGELVAVIGDNLDVVSGATYPDVVVSAPTGHVISSVPLFGNEADIDVSSLYYNNGQQTFKFNTALIIYDKRVSYATELDIISEFTDGPTYNTENLWDGGTLVVNNFSELSGVYTCTLSPGELIIYSLLSYGASYRANFDVTAYSSGAIGLSSNTTSAADRLKTAAGGYTVDFVANGFSPTMMMFVTNAVGNAIRVNYVKKQKPTEEFTDFEVPGGYTNTGVAYDSVNNNLWSSDFTNSKIKELTKNGVFVSEFAVSGVGAGGLQGVAYDSINDALWVGHDKYLKQYTKAGSLSVTHNITSLANTITSALTHIPSDDTLLVGVYGTNTVKKISCSDGSILSTINVAGVTEGAGIDGIAYDTNTDTLWVTQNGANSIINCTMAGATIQIYDNPAPGNQGEGICIDTDLNVLWFSADDQFHSATPNGNRIFIQRLLD